MRLRFNCISCAKETEPRDEQFVVAINEQSIYRPQCSQGHSSVIVVTEAKYVQLFEIGLNAVVDQYHREAVSSFGASLERFYEFTTRVLALHQKVSTNAVEAAWKSMARQSERQLGAFVAAYLLVENEVPILLSDKMVKFRNDIIHKGAIPSSEEAIAFGDAVLSVIRPVLRLLRTKYQDSFHLLNVQLRRATLCNIDLHSERPVTYSLALALRDVGQPFTDSRDVYSYVLALGAAR